MSAGWKKSASPTTMTRPPLALVALDLGLGGDGQAQRPARVVTPWGGIDLAGQGARRRGWRRPPRSCAAAPPRRCPSTARRARGHVQAHRAASGLQHPGGSRGSRTRRPGRGFIGLDVSRRALSISSTTFALHLDPELAQHVFEPRGGDPVIVEHRVEGEEEVAAAPHVAVEEGRPRPSVNARRGPMTKMASQRSPISERPRVSMASSSTLSRWSSSRSTPRLRSPEPLTSHSPWPRSHADLRAAALGDLHDGARQGPLRLDVDLRPRRRRRGSRGRSPSGLAAAPSSADPRPGRRWPRPRRARRRRASVPISKR